MNIKIAYLGGGSKNWARVFMNDLALTKGLGGEIALYDIDLEAAYRNKAIGDKINLHPDTKSIFKYEVYEKIEDALSGADFVIISILPGTFEEMRVDVHEPEEYGILQSVGDTAGPGGVLRALRTVPIYEDFAKKIAECAPKAWVINFTNPMSICVQTLYDVYPDIKAFGCCHEVFHAQDFLCLVLKKIKGIKAHRKEIYTDASGVNHFTWINEAYYNDINLLELLPEFIDKYYEKGYFERGTRYQYKYDTFAYGNKVKMDLFRRFGSLGAAGDRHLVEFVDRTWYLKNKKMLKHFAYSLTTVDSREERQKLQIEESIALANGTKDIVLRKSDEEAVDLMQAILGLKTVVSNVNMPNHGQMAGIRKGAIVETNCVFTNNLVKPIVSKPLSTDVLSLVARASQNIDMTYEGIKKRDWQIIFNSFVNQGLCAGIERTKLRELFIKMVNKTSKYLVDYYDLSTLDKIL